METQGIYASPEEKMCQNKPQWETHRLLVSFGTAEDGNLNKSALK